MIVSQQKSNYENKEYAKFDPQAVFCLSFV